jgi:hypothetical protein
MTTNSISYLQSTLANQLMNSGLTNSSSKSSKNSQASTFAQMLSEATANSPDALSKLVSNFQATGIQNQGQSLDPTSIGA